MAEINRSVCVSGFMEKGGRGLGMGENRTGGLEQVLTVAGSRE